MKTALVCGAGGFIGGHLVKKLKREGCPERSGVRGVDIKEHEFAETKADDFRLLDLREPHNCWEALSLGPAAGPCDPEFGEGSPRADNSPSTVLRPSCKAKPSSGRTFDDTSSNKTTFDEVYQLAADMGGMGFIHTAEADTRHPATPGDIMRNSALINNNEWRVLA